MKEKKEPIPGFSRWFGSEGWKSSLRIKLFIYAIFAIALYLLLINHILPKQYEIRLGKPSPATVVSPVTKVDTYATNQAKREAAESVEPVYIKNDRLTIEQIGKIDSIFVTVKDWLEKDRRDAKQFKAAFEATFSQTFSDSFYQRLLKISPDRLQVIRLTTRQLVSDILQQGVRKDQLSEKQEDVDEKLYLSVNALNSNEQALVSELAKKSLIVNEFYDEKQTEQQKQAVQDAIKPIPINKGQIIVAYGEVVTDDQYRKLQELGLLKKESNILPHMGMLLFIVTIIGILYYYIYRFEPKIHQDNMNLLLLFMVMLLTLLGMKVISYGQNLEWYMIGYLAPIGLGSMLVTLLLNIRLSLVSTVILAIFCSVIFNGENHMLFDFRLGFVSLVSGVTAAYALANARKRSAILRAGLISSVAAVVPVLALNLMVPTEATLREWLQSVGFAMLGAIFSAVLTIGFLPYFETLFGILSPLRLLELANPNHPLMRKLLVESPGTYHHSIIVGNLSEAAAEAIGADGLLARVGAYYHDVGKTKRPQFFIENQLYGNNPHDRISPNLSKSIVISHTRDGVELLKAHNIPKPIQDIAAQHHGTTLLKYFYVKAREKLDHEQVRSEDYRYPGPKAQFKEAAIVGICDCVEAAVRSLSRPTPSRIENMVKKIIQDRLEDGQFDECDITLKELKLIGKSVCETLQGIFHSRIEYPDEPVNLKGAKKA
ncbi:HD family phosphohydrolase [Thermoactinomyces mirandus]|uniref:HD family phosphohydrolase n=1 Tax=Thermoactinomyces mirandus TaxID=2756294 RepID=A0A7W1XPH2_9BACL|nr:HD family phosphohydrolase [Thermoactinomyces mirandus]MBA4600752.1 HD family phosphohydrolase [Thermoactinomyces mirandus]